MRWVLFFLVVGLVTYICLPFVADKWAKFTDAVDKLYKEERE